MDDPLQKLYLSERFVEKLYPELQRHGLTSFLPLFTIDLLSLQISIAKDVWCKDS